MLDLDVDPNALAAAMGGFMAQRLVRTVCQHCRTPVELTDYARKQIETSGVPEALSRDAHTIYEHNPDGCEHCHDGWSGRAPVFELILPTPEVRLAVEEGNLKALERSARLQKQYRTLGQHAMEMVLSGETTLIEAMAVTGSVVVATES